MIYKADSPDSIHEIKDVEGHITRINRAVQNVFSSLDPDDNFSADELKRYEETRHNLTLLDIGMSGLFSKVEETENKIKSELKVSEEGIKLLVGKGDVANQINLSSDTLEITGNRLEINSPNFVVNDTRAVARGEIVATGGSIAGWEIKTDSSGNSSWGGSSNSRINARNVVGQYGEAKEINAYGEVYINATPKGNFEDIILNNTRFHGHFSCSAIDCSGRIICGTMQLYTTKREYHEAIPTDKTTPKVDEVEDYGIDKRYRSRYNKNESPVGGLVASGNIECYFVSSSISSVVWSDRRLKENIQSVEKDKSYKLLNELKPCSFIYKADGEKASGFIAQEAPKEYRYKMRNGLYGLRYDSIMCCLDSVLKDMGERYGRDREG
jgi:hypothetical protein